MATRMQQRRGTAAQWVSSNAGDGPILNAGEIGWESDTNKFKIGDGVSYWDDLTYFVDATDVIASSLGAYLQDSDVGAISGVAGLDASKNLIVPGASIIIEGATADAYETTLTVVDPTAARTITFPNATGTLAILDATQTLTNKTLTLPKINENVAVTSTATELNILDGATLSTAELNYVDGVTSAIQTQIDTKAPTASPTFTGTVSGITKSMVGLGNVDNTADTAKPVSTAQATAIATAKSEAIADATSQVNALLTGAPAALNTLDELAAALGDDANFASTVTTSLGLKAPLASPTFTGTVTVAASGVAFTDGTQTKEGVASRTPIVQKTAAYTLSALTERDSLIEVSSATGVTITIPTNTAVAYPVGTSIDILQTGAGQVTIAPVDGTVTVNATPGLKLRTTWSSATLFKRAANTWVVFGDLTA